ncbi:AAA family ATPase [Nocardia rhizosphaerihabitans]|uniref:phosphatase domain-containing protein n=1 Tax=Nocardia rhizosphaerihabitans TaxID=1691570 RepID=UPI00366B5A74
MASLTITRGYPGSGKTTWAYQQVKTSENTIKAPSRDDLRKAFFDVEGVGNDVQETLITELQAKFVRSMLDAGLDTIVDNTHLKYRDAQKWAELAEDLGIAFACRDFEVDREVCKERISSRTARGGRAVPFEVVDRMARRNPIDSWKPVVPRYRLNIEPIEYNPDLPSAYIFDIDGTLALNTSGRSPFDMTRLLGDEPNSDVTSVFVDLRLQAGELEGWGVERPQFFVFSGRTDDGRTDTETWLDAAGIRYDALHMRKKGDQRKDSVVKLEMFNEHIRDKYNAVVFDDRNQVVSMWRRLGLTCFQVAEGDF